MKPGGNNRISALAERIEDFGYYREGGSIHINPANKGKFNETKRRTGKTTEELTHSSNPLTRKRAIFAQNAAKWNHKHGDGGLLDNDYMIGYLYNPPALQNTVSDALPAITQKPIDLNELKRRQYYIESRFNNNAVSPAGARGAYQIMPVTLKDYTSRTGETGDLNDYAFNEKIRDYYMNKHMNSSWAMKNNQSEYNRVAKALAAYNWGSGNLLKYLEKQKVSGSDIYQGTDWIAGLPKETRNYIKFILDGEDIGDKITNAAYEKAKKRRFDLGGKIERYGADKVKEAIKAIRSSDTKKANVFDGNTEETSVVDRGKKNSHKVLGNLLQKYTDGVLTRDDVDLVLTNPKDYMTKKYSKEQLDTMRNRLYKEYYPLGYYLPEGPQAAGDIMLGNPSKDKQVEGYRKVMRGALSHLSTPTDYARDSYFAQWLGIPEEERRYNMLEPSPYYPTEGVDGEIQAFRLKPGSVYDKDKQIVDLYNTAVKLSGNKNMRTEPFTISKGSGNNYSVFPELRVYAEEGYSPDSKKENKAIINDVVKKWREPYAEDSIGLGLNRFTVGAGTDPDKGQYISIFDKWDINPADHSAYGIAKKAKKFFNIPQDFDVTGGLGKPFYIYDRVYLDDYYDVDSRPDADSYYGGYIVPSVVTANKK